MEMGVTSPRAAADSGGVGADAEGFGTRPSSGRPHSIRLDGASNSAAPGPGSRGLDVLLGVGIGVLAMYYLDPGAGSQRRARVRDTLVDAAKTANPGRPELSPALRLAAVTVGAALTLFGGQRRDAMGAAVGVLGSALLAGGASTARGKPPEPAPLS